MEVQTVQAVLCKRFLEGVKPVYVNKTEASFSLQKIPPPFNRSYVLSPASDKINFFIKIFSNMSNLDDSGIYLSAFSCRTKLKLHNIPLTLKLDWQVITNFDYSGVSAFLCIPVTVLKSCKPELNVLNF